MRLVDELLRLSATDLANHLGCVHLSQLNRAAAEGRAHRPKWQRPGRRPAARARHRAREGVPRAPARDRRRARRRDRCGDDRARCETDARRDARGRRRDLSGAARRRALVRHRGLPAQGRAAERRSARGRTKSRTRSSRPRRARARSCSCASTRSCSRASKACGPIEAHVVAPHHDFDPEPYRLADFTAYYRLVKRRLEAALEDEREHLSRARAAVRGVRVVGRSATACGARDDHLCFVAGISRLQIKELKRIDVTTLERLGDLEDVPKPTRGSRDALVRTRDQAAIQLRARRVGLAAARDPRAARPRARPRAAAARRRRTTSSSTSRATGSRRTAAASTCSACWPRTTRRAARARRRLRWSISAPGPRRPRRRRKRSSSSST